MTAGPFYTGADSAKNSQNYASFDISGSACWRGPDPGGLRQQGTAVYAAGHSGRRARQTGKPGYTRKAGDCTGSGYQYAVSLRFSKMHGIGNDFVVIDGRTQGFALEPARVRAIGDRHTGVGFDQLLTIEPARDPSCAFYYGIWNTDGSPAGQCGNGVRCVAAWLYRAGLLAMGEPARLESPSGPVSVKLLSADRVAVDMGEPDFTADASGFDGGDMRIAVPTGDTTDTAVDFGVVSMGNPHAVVAVDALDDPWLEVAGPTLTAHPRFADGVNTGFVHKLTRDHLQLHVHERGAGWTRACGTGACAAMAVLHERGEVGDSVRVDLPGGRLRIDWPGPGHTLWMTGPATFVFEGEWLDSDLCD